MPAKKITYLALGDSYTIGESVPAKENFPNQVVALLREKNIDADDPHIIAKTGWTTDELAEAIEAEKISGPFDFVSLLIGVNNQYRGRPAGEYQTEFKNLLQQAIGFAGGKKENVVVLSIPDWSATPFAEDRDRKKISEEIDVFNLINKTISEKHDVFYIDITPGTRLAATDKSLLAADGLHPSPKEYLKWATAVAAHFLSILHR